MSIVNRLRLILVTCCLIGVTASANAVSATEIYASSGFNDQIGINSNVVPNSPYQLNSTVDGQGFREPGWADAQWLGVAYPEVIQVRTDFVAEGDGAVAIHQASGGTPSAERSWSNVTPQFGVEQQVLYRPGSAFAASIRRTGGTYDATVGVVWRVNDAGQLVLQDGPNAESTGIFLFPNQWYHVRVDVDVETQTWTLALDGETLETPDPLDFRRFQPFLDRLDYRGGSREFDFYFDDVKVTSPVPEPSSFLLAALGMLGLVAFGWKNRRLDRNRLWDRVFDH